MQMVPMQINQDGVVYANGECIGVVTNWNASHSQDCQQVSSYGYPPNYIYAQPSLVKLSLDLQLTHLPQQVRAVVEERMAIAERAISFQL